MQERVMRQINYLRIISPAWIWGGQGASCVMPSKTYFDVPYENEAQVARLLKQAKGMFDADEDRAWLKEPVSETYWKTVEEERGISISPARQEDF